MKKLVALSLGLIMLTGCGQGNANQSARSEQSTAAQTAAEAAPQTDDTGAQTTAAPQQNTSSAGEISREDAQGLALADAGVSDDAATFVKVKKDRDDGRVVYDVEFYADNTRYEYEINAADGSVVSSERDSNVNGGSTQAGAGIDEAAARSVALDEAGLTEDAVTFVKTSLDYDDGRSVWDIEFVANDVEYSFEINADDGSILEYSQESVYD